MATKKTPSSGSSTPRSFTGLIKGRSKPVQAIAKALREVVQEELPGANESYYGGQRPMAMYRTSADVCWIQPLTSRCNVYFMRGPELTDDDRLLEGNSSRHRYIKVNSTEAVEQLPIRQWLRETVALNLAELESGESFDEVLQRLRVICLALPQTKETLTWGKPHFRVGEKIFCGCGENAGRPFLGLKMEPNESVMMMKIPGIEKAPYSRPGDGWVAVDPNIFDDWDGIERLLIGSFRLIAPKRLVASLDSGQAD
jgi:predicted DNA-binding protein (MmcQ/YjbR family)